MPENPIPLSVLDLAPVVEGSTPAQALHGALDLARHAEEAGYLRYWVAEHHFSAGVAAASPAVLIAAIAAVTSRIRVGSGAVQLGHQTPLAVVEAFGTLCGLYPGRIDLGLGRSGRRRREDQRKLAPRHAGEARVVNGLLIPPHYSPGDLHKSPRFALNSTLLQQPGAVTPDFGEQVNDILAFLAGTWRSADGIAMTAVPGAGADAQVWILGSSGGQSAEVAGAHGLPFAANYHVSPSTVLEAAQSYRAAFRPSLVLSRPHVMVSADVVVAPTDEEARELAAGYGLWVRSVRSPAGAMEYPSAESAAAARWTPQDAALVADRVATQFAGSPGTVAKSLRVLQDATGADELLVTTITHSHADRVRSLRLLAGEWGLGGLPAGQGDHQREHGDRDDRGGDHPQALRSGPRQLADPPHQRGHAQDDQAGDDVDLEHRPAERGERDRGARPGQGCPLPRQAGIAFLRVVVSHGDHG